MAKIKKERSTTILVTLYWANCPYFAKAELLADYLQKNLPNFRIHKIAQHPDNWEQWLVDICEKNGWKHKHSPIIWRELLDRGGKGLLLGGFNDFLEHAQHYYGITSYMLSEEMLRIAEENLQTNIDIEKEEEELKSLINPLVSLASGFYISSYIVYSYIDLTKAKLYRYDSAIWGPPSFSRPLLDMIFDGNWLRSDFVSALSSLSSWGHHCIGMSPAHVIATVLRYWYQDSPPGEIISLGVISEGQFGVPEGIVFSMPVMFRNGNWEVLTEIEITQQTQRLVFFIQEKQVALGEILELYQHRRGKIITKK
uniref:Malate dehydrogenase 1B n=1 Tax=Sphenodon punctatus TaxID=8508 RepID=A0A8D0G8W8_SPHPU